MDGEVASTGWIVAKEQKAPLRDGALNESSFSLFLLGSLIAAAYRRTQLAENGFRIVGERPIRSELKIFLVGLGASWRGDDLVGLGIDGGLVDQRLALQIVRDGLVGIGRDSLVGCGDCGVEIADPVHDDRLI